MSGERWALVFDGECGFCRRSVEWVRNRDREDRIEPLPFQDSEVRERFQRIPLEDFEQAMHLIAPDGRSWSGARAGEELLRLLPRWRWIAPMFRVPGVRWIAQRVYRLVADHRHSLGCGTHCDLG